MMNYELRSSCFYGLHFNGDELNHLNKTSLATIFVFVVFAFVTKSDGHGVELLHNDGL